MTATTARKFAFWALIAWSIAIVLSLVFAGSPTSPGIVTIAGAVLLAAATALLLSWVTSMVAGPFVLVSLRNRPNTLGVWTTIVLPLSLAFGLVCAIAFPVHWTDDCFRRGAVVPLITLPVYLASSPERAPIAYFRFKDQRNAMCVES